MQKVAITDQLQWLVNTSCSPRQTHWLPRGFDAYVKSLLPIGIDRSTPLETYFFKRSIIEDINARAAFWRKYDVNGLSATARLTPIKYRELAKAWGIPYDKDFTSDKIIKACGDWLPNLRESDRLTEQFVHLVTQLLGPATPTYFSGCIDNGDYHWVDDQPADLLQVYQRDR